MDFMAEAVGSLVDIARGGDGWDVGRLGTEFVNQVIRVDQLRIQDAAERERKRDIAQRRADAQRRRNRRY